MSRAWMAASACFLMASGQASALTCKAGGGPRFQAPSVAEVSAAALAQPGSASCDVVYHVDGRRYILGGCDHDYVGLFSPVPGAPISHRHGRLTLNCS